MGTSASQKTPLFESGHIVSAVTVLMLCRNGASYLPRFFETARGMERMYACRFQYVFVENGSTDGTEPLLRGFLADRDGLQIHPGNSAVLDTLPRTRRIAAVRNIGANCASTLDSDWTMVVDADVYFHPRVVQRLLATNPTQQGIGMLAAFGLEAFPGKTPGTWDTVNHYYDTFSFIPESHVLYWPHCIFEGCEKCPPRVPDVTRVPLYGIYTVRAAFGGLAFVKTDILRNPRVRWNAPEVGGQFWCEHIGFCDALLAETGMKVAIATEVPVLWDSSTYGRT